MMTKPLGRRKFLKRTAAGAAAASVTGFPAIVRAQNRRIVVTAGGGAYGKAQVEAYFKPFMEETGIEVHATLSGLSLAEKKAQVETGNVTADLVSMGFADVEIMSQQRLARGPSTTASSARRTWTTSAPRTVTRTAWASSTGRRSWPIARTCSNRAAIPGTGPEFWDTKRFPGPRCMGDASYRYSFEFALLADGVPLDKIYPLDVDRALESYSRIRDDVVAWWGKSAALPAQLINDKEVVLCSVANGRIKEVIEAGAPVNVEWNQGILYHTAYAVLKGARNVEDTMKLLAWVARPESQARMAEIIAYGPPNRKAFDHIAPEVAKNLPTNPAYRDKMLLKDDAWWVAEGAPGKSNRELVIEKWEEWKIKG